MNALNSMRIGIGMDVHPLKEDNPLIVGGVVLVNAYSGKIF